MPLPTPPTSSEVEEETTTTSEDKVATWASHATSGETSVRLIFIFVFSPAVGSILNLLLYSHFHSSSSSSFLGSPSSGCLAVIHETSLNTATWTPRMIWTSFRMSLRYQSSLFTSVVFLLLFVVNLILSFPFLIFCFLIIVQQEQTPAVNWLLNKVVFKY